MTTAEIDPLQSPTDDALRRDDEAVAEILLARGQTMVAAESCTGGWIAKVLTDIAGSSAWFECGVVAERVVGRALERIDFGGRHASRILHRSE